jgi:hypothetical protein
MSGKRPDATDTAEAAVPQRRRPQGGDATTAARPIIGEWFATTVRGLSATGVNFSRGGGRSMLLSGAGSECEDDSGPG